MSLQMYHDEDNRQRTALIVKEGRKWMSLLIVRSGRLAMIRRPLTDQRYMTPALGSERKAKASMRRLARKRGTTSTIRKALASAL